MITYIHYGSDHYDPSLFIPIHNCDWKPIQETDEAAWLMRLYQGKRRNWRRGNRSRDLTAQKT